MRVGNLSIRGLVTVLFVFGPFSFGCPGQPGAKSWDELVQYQVNFLRVFYPESFGKKYWITFERAIHYDEGESSAVPEYGISFDVDVGDGPKSQEMMCCVGGSIGGVLGGSNKQSEPVQLRPKPEPLNLGRHGEVYPKQYLRAVFVFDADGRFSGFRKLPNKPPKAEPDFWAELKQHPEMSDADLATVYKTSGAKYRLGDRDAFKHDLAIGTLEQFLGKLRIVKIDFLPTRDFRIDSLGGFSECEVYLEGPEKKDYVAEFDGFSGQLLSVFHISEKEKKMFYPDFGKDAPD